MATSWVVLLVCICNIRMEGSSPVHDAPFTIQTPLPGERFVTNETVTFKVSMKDRHVDASQVAWTSNISGVLGHGPEFQISSLPAGVHKISVSVNGETQEVSIREFKDLWDLYRRSPSQAEIDRILKDFSLNWADGSEPDEKWAAYEPLSFDQGSLAPSRLVLLANLDILRHQVFSEPLPYGDGLRVYDHFRKYVKSFHLSLGCSDSSGGGGNISLGRGQNTWSLYRGDCKSLTPSSPLTGYVGALGLLMHEARHSEPGSPVHATCYGFSNMDPSLDKGSGHAWAALYAMWVYKYALYDPPAMKQQARLFAYAVLSRFCSKPTSANPKVQAIVDELLGELPANATAAPSPLPAPKLLLPEKNVEVHDRFKPILLSWAPVESAAAYVMQWDYGVHGKNGMVWTSEQPQVSRQPDQTKGWWFEPRRRGFAEFPTTETSYPASFVGTQPHRWRVWAVDAKDNPGTKSEWREVRVVIVISPQK